jgi:2-C-methyl-D-erythritol 4-phosphate cytidylyltransferase
MNTIPRYFVIIPSAGVGARMSQDCPKQYLSLLGKSILQHTIAVFLDNALIEHVFVVVNAKDEYINQIVVENEKISILRCGGEQRRDTVQNALFEIKDRVLPQDWVLVHDAARPGLSQELLNKLIKEVGEHRVGGLLALPVVDTVKRQLKDKIETLPRNEMWLAQTPQMFRFEILQKALEKKENVTDESSAVEVLGLVPKLVEGDASNLKVTNPADLPLVKYFLKHQKVKHAK